MEEKKGYPPLNDHEQETLSAMVVDMKIRPGMDNAEVRAALVKEFSEYTDIDIDKLMFFVAPVVQEKGPEAAAETPPESMREATTLQGAEENPYKDVQTALVIVQPFAMRQGFGPGMLDVLKTAGFQVLGQYSLFLLDGQARAFVEPMGYGNKKKGIATRSFTGNIFAAVMRRTDAYEILGEIIGDEDPQKARPGTLRWLYGHDKMFNGIYYSQNTAAFVRDTKVIELFYRLYYVATQEAMGDVSEFVREKLESMGIIKTAEEVANEEASRIILPSDADVGVVSGGGPVRGN